MLNGPNLLLTDTVKILLLKGTVYSVIWFFVLSLIRMTKDEKVLAIFKGLML